MIAAMAETVATQGSLPRTARERARAEINLEILDAGRRHLATSGAQALSLRAVARDLGMASSAVYRYVPSRDALLTMLITDAYESLGTSVEADEGPIAREDVLGRFSAVCHGVRSWALANPNEYALIYGSPVPGYVAPEETIAPASRVSLLLVRVLSDAIQLHRVAAVVERDHVLPVVASSLAPVRAALAEGFPDVLVQLGLMVWMALFGTVSFELFGQLHNVVADAPGDREAFFSECVARWALQLGLTEVP